MNVLNISIDDISPHPLSSLKVLENCDRILQKFPLAIFTLFIPMSYWRTKGETATPNALPIDQYPDFCKVLAELPEKNFELCYHGLLHGIPHKTNNDEFRSLNSEETTAKLNEMRNTARIAGLGNKFKNIFRPPAWRISPKALTSTSQWGMEVISLAPEEDVRSEYQNADLSLPAVSYYNSCPPWKPLQLFRRTSLVYHACEWSPNYLSRAFADDLASFLKNQSRQFTFTAITETCAPLQRCHEEAL